MKTCKTAIFLLTISIVRLGAQNAALDRYIAMALSSNLKLQQEKLDHQVMLSEVAEARGMYLPSLSFNARYSRAEGGRTISFPLLDIFNGYSLINNLANPEIRLITPEQFRNEEIYFLREKEHETKLSLTQPLFSTRLYYNLRIRKALSAADGQGMEVSTRQLVADIREAYLSYLKASEVFDWLNDAKQLSLEYIRVNERLLANGKVTPEALYRARAEDLKVDQEIADALRDRQLARSYFNYLTGQPSGSEILADDSLHTGIRYDSPEAVIALALQNREELWQLKEVGDAASFQVKMYRTNSLPSLYAAADYGFQGEQYRFTGQYDYLLASVVLRWNIFGGFQEREKLRQALLERQIAEKGTLDARQQIEMEALDAWYALQAAGKTMEASAAEEQAMRKIFDMARLRYENGQASMLEYTDARTQWTLSSMNRIIKKYDYLAACFRLLRITADEDINAYYTLQP